MLSYESDDFFLPHRDNACKEGGSSFWPLCKSFYSILIYLADSEDGAGVTRFYCGGDAATLDQSSGDLLSQTAAASLRPTEVLSQTSCPGQVVPSFSRTACCMRACQRSRGENSWSEVTSVPAKKQLTAGMPERKWHRT